MTLKNSFAVVTIIFSGNNFSNFFIMVIIMNKVTKNFSVEKCFKKSSSRKKNVGACAAAPPAATPPAAATHSLRETEKRKQFIQLFDRNFCFQSETFSRKNTALNYSESNRNWMRISEFCCDVQSFKNSFFQRKN